MEVREWCDGIVPLIDAAASGFSHDPPEFDRSLRTAAELTAERSLHGVRPEMEVGRQ